jgi:hypothetical protein
MYLTRNVEPVGAELDALLLRAGIDRDAVRETVRGVLEQVRKEVTRRCSRWRSSSTRLTLPRFVSVKRR